MEAKEREQPKQNHLGGYFFAVSGTMREDMPRNACSPVAKGWDPLPADLETSVRPCAICVTSGAKLKP